MAKNFPAKKKEEEENLEKKEEIMERKKTSLSQLLRVKQTRHLISFVQKRTQKGLTDAIDKLIPIPIHSRRDDGM